MSLFRKFATVGGSTLVSRFFGFARETLMATALGTGPMADAFYAAFVFPNLFRRLFAEGAFNAAFVRFLPARSRKAALMRPKSSPKRCSVFSSQFCCY